MNFNDVKFRCSSLGDLMTDSRTGSVTEIQLAKIDELLVKQQAKPLTPNQKDELERLITKRDNPELSETCKSKLVEIYINVVYKRKTDITTKYMARGLATEEDLITLISRISKKFFRKNAERISNEFIIGEPDIFEGPEIRKADRITDGKSCWSFETFLPIIIKPIHRPYWFQLQGYSALTGAPELCLANGLVNMPEPMVKEEVWKLYRKMGEPGSEDPIWKEAERELRKSFIYDDVPLENRLIAFEFERDQQAINTIYERAPLWRGFLAELYKKLNPLKGAA